jgi:hypothetical protein
MSDPAGRCRLMHVDLAKPLSVVSAESDLHLVFWLDGLPLGRCEVTAEELPLSVATLAALASQAIAPAVGARLCARGFEAPLLADAGRGERDGRRGGRPRVPPTACLAARATCSSCCRSRRDPRRLDDVSGGGGRLGRRLHARSTRGAGALPRIVACHAIAPPRDPGRRQRLAYRCRASPGRRDAGGAVRARGSSRAGDCSQHGVRETTGAIVAFTDDDVVVDAGWIARLVVPFAAPDVMAVTGMVLPGELETDAQRMAEERLWSFNREFRPRVFVASYFARMRARGVPVWHIGAGANMAMRRDAFARVGLFDERLGAGAAGCSEDSELWYRILAEGWRCVYEPAAVVFHYHRAAADGLRDQWYAYMRGPSPPFSCSSRATGTGATCAASLQLPFFYAVWLRDVARRGARVEGPIWWAAVSGTFAGIAFYARHRNAPAIT